ncbi:phosphate/phosphite/phosphonate ABC transporter substrate-binding protein [Okeania sp. SIO1H2]|nr:phosphate/phosphite/phosphonate ABC transporter substrate-binding protein [Okeania sp. SIO1H2]NES79714.1 phosphate/phosphite/phosphonate ABC transporter substrate-binding protein [Okeania sp. SIO1H4]NET22753.1 phosphate/phosphite/phosphonate ABC transporter substrate-binding protein [Okeania sp. SIO1H5]NET97204.1 phosphate/phosphite/phosphonate ABC transporter substrate-binding protein [Okeania sp. SIO1H2]
MLRKLFVKLSLFGMVMALIGSSLKSSALNPKLLASTPDPSTIVIADISNNPSKKIKRYQPLADYLAERLGQFGVKVGDVEIASDLQEMANYLNSGEVDIYFDSPYPAMIVSDRSNAKPILRRWKGGVPDYYTVIFTMKDRGIQSLEDLKSKIVGFDEVSSTSGYMLPTSLLIENDLNPQQKKSASSTVSADEVGFVFTDDDENTIQWVISGKVAAGAVDIGTFMEIPEANRQAMIVLAKSEKVARHVVLVRPDMKPEILEAIKAILIKMDQTAEGREVLEKFEKTAKFDDFPPESSIERMRELYELVQNR